MSKNTEKLKKEVQDDYKVILLLEELINSVTSVQHLLLLLTSEKFPSKR